MKYKFKGDYFPFPRKSDYGWQRIREFEVVMLPEEVDEVGQKLKARFPVGLIFPTKYHRNWIETEPIQFYPTLTAAGKADDTPAALFRVPTPEDVVSEDPVRLIGGLELSRTMSRVHFWQMGRCIRISWTSRKRPSMHIPMKQERDGEAIDCSFEFLCSTLEISALFDIEDQEVCGFLDEVEKILLDMTTCDYASYDVQTGALINPKRRNAAMRRSAGAVRYAALHDRTYFGFCSRYNASEMMGVRPELRAALRAEAGLPV